MADFVFLVFETVLELDLVLETAGESDLTFEVLAFVLEGVVDFDDLIDSMKKRLNRFL